MVNMFSMKSFQAEPTSAPSCTATMVIPNEVKNKNTYESIEANSKLIDNDIQITNKNEK